MTSQLNALCLNNEKPSVVLRLPSCKVGLLFHLWPSGTVTADDRCVRLQTTTINCLTGVVAASGGDALVYGEALSSPGGVDRIRSVMGVCPQFDVLWNELTGIEHLRIYGNIKVAH